MGLVWVPWGKTGLLCSEHCIDTLDTQWTGWRGERVNHGGEKWWLRAYTLISRMTNKARSASFKDDLWLNFFGSRHCTCAYTVEGGVIRRAGNVSVDLSLFVLLFNTEFMNQFKFDVFFISETNITWTEKIYYNTPLSNQRKDWST